MSSKKIAVKAVV